MGERYGSTGNQATVASTNKTMLSLTGGTGVLARIYDLLVGADGTPDDRAMVYSAQRHTADGTNTAVTPEPLDADRALAAEVAGGENHTAEPTVAGIPVIELPVNLRATFRWMAAPGGELVTALTLNSGFSFRVREPSGNYVSSAKATVHHEE